MNKISFCFCFSLLISNVFSQGGDKVLILTVRDANSNPLSNIKFYIKEIPITTKSSNSQGEIRVNIPANSVSKKHLTLTVDEYDYVFLNPSEQKAGYIINFTDEKYYSKILVVKKIIKSEKTIPITSQQENILFKEQKLKSNIPNNIINNFYNYSTNITNYYFIPEKELINNQLQIKDFVERNSFQLKDVGINYDKINSELKKENASLILDEKTLSAALKSYNENILMQVREMQDGLETKIKDLQAQLGDKRRYDKYLSYRIQNLDSILGNSYSLTSRADFIMDGANNLINDIDYKGDTITSENGTKNFGYSIEDIARDTSYKFAFETKEGIIRVKKDNKYGYMNTQMKFITQGYEYDYAEDFSGGFGLVGAKNIKNPDRIDYGFIDVKNIPLPDNSKMDSRQGRRQLPYDMAVSFKNGKALVQIDNNWFFITKQGKKTGRDIAKYNELNGYYITYAKRLDFNNLIWMQYDFYTTSRNFLINDKGKRISDLYHSIGIFNKSGNAVVNKNYNWGVLDTNCKEILELEWGMIMQINQDIYAVQNPENGHWGFIKSPINIDNNNRKIDYPCVLDSVKLVPTMNDMVIVRDPNSNYGIMDVRKYGVTEKELYFIPLKFNYIEPFYQQIRMIGFRVTFQKDLKSLVFLVGKDGKCYNISEKDCGLYDSIIKPIKFPDR